MNYVQVWLKAKQRSRICRDIMFDAARMDALDLVEYARACDERLQPHIQRRRAQWEASKVNHAPKPETIHERPFWHYWDALDHEQQQRIKTECTPDLMQQIERLQAQVYRLPARIAELWVSGDQRTAKQEIARLYRLRQKIHHAGVEQLDIVKRRVLETRATMHGAS